MDTLDNYREIIERVLTEYAVFLNTTILPCVRPSLIGVMTAI